jgi:branched-chain amino acid transport system permease protein
VVLLNLVIGSILIGGVYALFSVGLSLLLGAMRVFNIAHGAILTGTALFTISIARHTGWHWIPLILCGAGIGALLGVPLEFLGIRPFRKGRVLREDMEKGTMIATLALVFIANDLMTHYTHAQIWSFPFGTFPTNVVRIGGVGLGVIYFINFGVALALIAAVAAGLRFTQAGRAVRAISMDHRSAYLLGVNVNRYSLFTAMLSSLLAGVAGVLLGMAFSAVTFSFGDDLLFQGFVIVILGGLGSIVGTLAAALLLALLQGVVAYYTGGSWGQAIALGVLVLLLVFRPQGIFGKPEIVRA